MAKVKFKFLLKSGKNFECIEELEAEQFVSMIDVIKTSMRDDNSGFLCFEDCCVRLSECAVIEWEVIDE